MHIEPIITEDGSPSFRNLEYDQPYHSKSGAMEEAFKKYALPLKIWERQNPVIYDVCFGIGYNTAAAIDLFIEKRNLEENPEDSIRIHCYENDEEILKKILLINPAFKNYKIIQELIKNYFEKKETELRKEKIFLTLHVGDARELVLETKDKADFVFFDPFSPQKHPEMWTEKFFKDIKDKMNKEGILATYSYARIVRENLKNAGFKVTPGPIVGRRSPSTIAYNDY